MEISNRELKKMQSLALEMLIELDRICRKHNIAYRIDGGTLLGAVRHKGFIPWDDDIDVTMSREEYNRFLKIYPKELNDKFLFQDWNTNKYYRRAFGQLVVKGTRCVSRYHENDKALQGISLDIFPFDYIPDDPKQLKKIKKKDVMIQRVIYSPYIIKRPDKLYRKIYFFCLSLIPFKWIKEYHKHIVKKINQKPSTMTKTFGFTSYRDRYGFPSKSFDERIEIEFEGHMFFAPKGYDAFLESLYGDYMKLPPKEKQIPNRDIVELEFGKWR